MSSPKVFVWAEKHRIRGEGDRWVGHAMAADGTQLKQIVRPGRDAIRIELVDDPDGSKYQEWYPSYDVIWLDEKYDRDPGWWRAKLYDEHRYTFRFVGITLQAPRFVEMRDEASGNVLGHVIQLEMLQCFYAVPGPLSPRTGDVYPDPAYSTLSSAILALHKALLAPTS